MYRPNRIGPWPLLDTENVIFEVPGTGLGQAPFSDIVILNSPDAIAGLEHKAFTVRMTDGIGLASGAATAYGVRVVGTQEFDVGEYMVSYGGSFLGFSADEGVAIRSVLGRVATNGVDDGSMAQWGLVPEQTNSSMRSAGAEITPLESSVNGTVLIGDWLPGGNLLQNELFFGFWIANGGASAANIVDVHMTVSLHRYLSDLRPFDPNR